MSLKHLNYSYTSVTIDPISNPEKLSQSEAQILADYRAKTGTRVDERFDTALKYPEAIELDYKLFKFNRNGIVAELVNKLKEAGLECEGTNGNLQIGKYGVTVYLDPYGVFSGTRLYPGAAETEFFLSVLRNSNSTNKSAYLNFKSKKYQHVNVGTYSRDSLDNEFKLYFQWTQEEVETQQFQLIQDRVLAGLKIAAQAIVEADSCGQVTPGQRGKHRVCGSCDLQLSCITSKRG